MADNWYRRPRVWIAAGVFLMGLAVYVATMNHTIDFWDCGEYITTSHILGIPHQPGTPLYVLMGRVFDILFGSPQVDQPAMRTALAVNFMSAFFSALALALVYLIILDLSRRTDPDAGWLAHAGGVVGAVFLMLSETYWNNAIEAEVYGLAACMISLLTWLALRWYDRCELERSNGILYLMIYLLGLGVGFHLGTLLVYPGIFVLMVLARKRQLPLLDLVGMSAGLALFLYTTITANNGLLVVLLVVYLAFALIRLFGGHRFVLIGTGLFVLGLSVHLMMLLRAPLDPAINQTQPDNFATLMSVLRREQYPPIDFLPRRADIWFQIKYYYNFFLEQFYFVGTKTSTLGRISLFVGPIFLGLLGIIHGLRRARPVFWMLVVNYLVNADILNLYLNFTDAEVRERDYFYFAAFMFFAVFIGIGAASLLRYAAGPEGRSSGELAAGEKVPPVRLGLLTRATAVFLILMAALPAILPGHVKRFEHDRTHNRIAYEYAWNMLAGLDENAILFTNGDNDTFPIWYLQEVEHFRRDVTVVNLSLVNLPWYVKQMRRRDPPMPLSFSDRELEQLRAGIYEDPQTGERQIIYVRDYVVADIVRTNGNSPQRRPAFFAVTIPRENMERYYPYLQMEGLAYRLTGRKGPDDLPTADGDRLLRNMYGVYDYSALLDGDTDTRRRRFAEDAGWSADVGENIPFLRQPVDIDYGRYSGLFGENRHDIFRDNNTVHLLGNYPAALVRGGYDFMKQAHDLPVEDVQGYEALRDKAIAAFELAYRFQPAFQPVLDFYPLLLVECGRHEDALRYLEEVRPLAPPRQFDRAAYTVLEGMASIGQVARVEEWLRGRIDLEPDYRFYYELLMRLYQDLGRIEDCRRILDLYERNTGQRDSTMEAWLDRAVQRALQNEQQRIRDAVEQAGEEGDDGTGEEGRRP